MPVGRKGGKSNWTGLVNQNGETIQKGEVGWRIEKGYRVTGGQGPVSIVRPKSERGGGCSRKKELSQNINSQKRTGRQSKLGEVPVSNDSKRKILGVLAPVDPRE